MRLNNKFIKEIDEILIEGAFNKVQFNKDDSILIDDIKVEVKNGILVLTKVEKTTLQEEYLDFSEVEIKRDQVEINAKRKNANKMIIDSIKQQKNISNIREVSIRDYNANILIDNKFKIKTLYSKNYTTKKSSVSSNLICGYFTLDWQRYKGADYYCFFVEAKEPKVITIDSQSLNNILSKKMGKGSIYRFNIKFDSTTGEIYDTADLSDKVDEGQIDFSQYRNFNKIGYIR